MEEIPNEAAAYELLKDHLEAHHKGEWVLIKDGKLIGTYETFEDADSDAVSRFGRGPCLIRQV
jgi:hypothetical protein